MNESVKTIFLDGLPIAKLKEKYLVNILKLKNEFDDLSKRQDINPRLIVYYDDEKFYFYNVSECFVYFKNEGE